MMLSTQYDNFIDWCFLLSSVDTWLMQLVHSNTSHTVGVSVDSEVCLRSLNTRCISRAHVVEQRGAAVIHNRDMERFLDTLIPHNVGVDRD